jgi:thioredoxin-like negative regulator of GroEL
MKYISCDVDTNTDWANKLSIRAVPTTILFDNGVEVRRLTGIQSKETVLKLFE